MTDSKKERISDIVYMYDKVQRDADERQERYVRELIELTSKREAAKLLGMDRKTLYNRYFTKKDDNSRTKSEDLSA